MGRGKAQKGRKVKTVASKQGKRGADTTSTNVPDKHDRKAGKASGVALTPAPPAAGQGVAGAKVVGFTNLGNTCFFNSVLQVLVASPPLQHFFSRANAKFHPGALGGAMQEVFDQTHAEPEEGAAGSKGEDKPSKAKKQKQRGCYAPQRLLTAVCKVAPHFKGFQQQDSHELLRVLLDGLQTEEAKAIAGQLKHESPHQAQEKDQTEPPKGFLSEVFGGQLSSRVSCEVCHHTSVTLEPFMDLSLPIPAGTLADMDDSISNRKGKKALKGKNSRKGEDESADTSSPPAQVEAQPGTRLKPKQKKKLLKEERKASKLERKKQAKADSAAGPASQTSAGKSDPTAPSSLASPQPAEATINAVDVAQSAQTEGTRVEAAQDAEGTAHGLAVDQDRRSSNPGDASCQMQHADPGLMTEQFGEHQPLSVKVDSSHAEPAEPHDVLQEFENLSPMLPEMPKPDTGDDLAGLFQAAFATCHKQMSPRGHPSRSHFSSPGQGEDEKDFSLYNDADEVMADDEVERTALDASDDEEEGKHGEVAGALLESFMGDAQHAAQVQASLNAEAEQEDDACTSVGNLFDESITEAADSANFQDFGAADEADLTDEQATTSGEAKLQSCLAEFFQQEQVTWECPAEKKVKRELRRNPLGGDSSPATPAHHNQDQQANGKRETRHTVSFSAHNTARPAKHSNKGLSLMGNAEEISVVTLIPGSVEQRGQVFRTSHGDPPFCRPLRLGAAFVLLTTTPDVRRPTRMHIKVQPQDDDEATLMLAANIRHLATADVPAPKVGDDEEEVRLAQAQVLMDCLADLLSQKGMEGTLAWCEAGVKLRCRSSGDTSSWVVLGHLPEEEGNGHWEYPSSADPSQHPCSEMDLLPSQELLSPSSSSGSPQSDFSSTADWRDSANLDSMLDMIMSQRHTEQSSSTERPSSSTGLCHTGQREPEHGSATATEAMSTAAESTEDGSSTAVAETGTVGTQVSLLQQAEPNSSADESDSGANNNTPSAFAPSESASSPEGCAAHEAASVHGSAQHEEGSYGLHQLAAPSPATDLQQTEQACETTPAATLEGDESLRASSDDKVRSDTSPHGHGQSRAPSGTSKASCQSDTSGQKQPEQAERTNGPAETDGKAPKTPIKTAPKRGGLVNVQRPAVKGYCIHRCPPLLTVHVKRFQQDMRGRLSKIDGAVPFPINLNLTPFCDPKGPDVGGAKYTLLGFVEHLGTMRSGHYVAYVQRGVEVLQSPHWQSLLQKHGLAAGPALGSQPSSSLSAAPGRKQKKGSGAKAAATASSTDQGETPKPNGAADGKAAARQHNARSDAAATSSAGAGPDDNSTKESSTLHLNGKADEQQSIPDDWETNGAKSTDKSQLGTASGPAGDSQPADTVTTDLDAASAVALPDRLTTSADDHAVGQPTPPAKEPDTSQMGSRHGRAAAEGNKLAGQRSWFYISDTQVKAVSEADILKREAYILLYMRTG